MTTKPDFNLLQDLLKEYTPEKRGVVSKSEVEVIAERLELKSRTEVELRNMRNFSVIFLSDEADSARERDEGTKFVTLMDMMSAIVSVIDHHIIEVGGEV